MPCVFPQSIKHTGVTALARILVAASQMNLRKPPRNPAGGGHNRDNLATLGVLWKGTGDAANDVEAFKGP